MKDSAGQPGGISRRNIRFGSCGTACAVTPPPMHHAPGMMHVVAIAELCRKEGIAQSLYYVWSKEFMEAGKR